MNEIITIKRIDLQEKLNEFFSIKPEHVFLMDLVPHGETTIFEMYPENEYSNKHSFATYLDNIFVQPKENEYGVTKYTAEKIQDFVFYIRNLKLDREKRLIIACENGRNVSGAVALWAMDWLMGDQEEEKLYALNPDMRPNEDILRDLYIYPLI